MDRSVQSDTRTAVHGTVNATTTRRLTSGSAPGETMQALANPFSAFNALSAGVSVVDEDLNVVFINDKLRAEVGDIVGQKCHATALRSEEMCSRCPVKSDWDYSKGPLVRRARDSNGRTIEQVISKYHDEVSDRDYWIAIERDVTEPVAIEAKMVKLAASLDQMTEAVCVADEEGRIVYVNRAFTLLTGYDEKGLAGQSDAGVSGATVTTIMKSATVKGWKGDLTGLRKDGSRYFTRVEAMPLKDPSGSTIGVVGILRDVTESRRERAESEKYAAELESKMEARTTELARKVSQLTTINKISRVITSILETDELMTEFVKSIAQGFGYQLVLLMMVDRDRGDLALKAAYGRHMEDIPGGTRQGMKEGIIGNAAYFGETLVSGNVESDPRYLRKYLLGTKSEMAVPVSFRGEILGVLDVQSDIRDAFTRNDASILEMLADMLATSITNVRIYTESKEREAALSVLDRISKQISYRLEPSVVLDQVARDAATLLKAEKAMVGLVDGKTNQLNWVAPYRVDKEKLKSLVFHADRGVGGRALRWLKTEVANDYQSDPDADENYAALFNINSMISAPLVIEGRGIGVVNVYNKLGGKAFTKSDALFLSSLADHAAVALENANLLTSLNQRIHSQLALLETAVSMQRQLDSGSIYELLADKLREVVWYDAIAFYRVDHANSRISPVVSRGPYTEEVLADSFPIGEGITGHVAKTGKAEIIADATQDPRVTLVPGTPLDREALIVIPLRSKDRVIGILTVSRAGGSTFSDNEFEIAQLFASQASVTLDNAELYRARESLLSDSKRKVEQMAKVLELTTSIMYMGDLEKLLQNITDAAVGTFGFRRAAIRLFDPGEEVFRLKVTTGYPDWLLKGQALDASIVMHDLQDRFKVGKTSYLIKYEDQDYGIESFTYLAHPELADKPRGSLDSWHERDELYLVLKDRAGRITGYIMVDEPVDLKVPSQSQIEVLEILSGIAAIAVENAKVYERQVVATNEIALLNDLMTHDINNFNQGIMGYIELLLQDKRLDENQKKYAERALIQVRNNARLIDNIRKLSKIRSMSDADLEPTDIQGAVLNAAESVTKMYPDRKVSVVSALQPGAHHVLANSYLDELFLNVLSNAVKFDSSKKVRVDVSIEEDKGAQGEWWVVSVIDRGRGIPDDRKNVVFERFATGVTGVKGFGLGLSIVQAVVDKFGGRVWAEDRMKGDHTKGTIFKIALPKARPPM